MISTHLDALQDRHAGLERKIRQEQTRPVPDSTRIQTLKREKLRIKEEISTS
ncbi:YdcH family protein [Croceicoccus sp. F390]|uniref:YdcH family protein n=1 Tax=Croceicoccus esteveae TaxID=3075597 RepID=A0ABU2ZHQ2_9SPHN|nr:YdcH family protein [Croceicoccus sp. F390]MDT0576129.1 YdcH family protein [Croceicoccus sp. F390]